MRTQILLLCTGNLCRSPMAEGLMRTLLPSHGLFSAGLGALDGAPADPLAVALLREAGIDIAAHRSRRLAGWMLAEAAQVYTMEAAQAAWLQRRYPQHAHKIARLGETCGIDIPDPHGQPRAAFAQSYAAIRRAVQARQPGWQAQYTPQYTPQRTLERTSERTSPQTVWSPLLS